MCGLRVVAPDPDAALERADGADVIVCFNERGELERRAPDYLAWLDEHVAGDRALWFPVPDLDAPGIDDALDLVETITGRLRHGAGAVLHCAGGIGRAPTMAVCVLMKLGMSATDALAHVAAYRPMGGPEAGGQAALVHAFDAIMAAERTPSDQPTTKRDR